MNSVNRVVRPRVMGALCNLVMKQVADSVEPPIWETIFGRPNNTLDLRNTIREAAG